MVNLMYRLTFFHEFEGLYQYDQSMTPLNSLLSEHTYVLWVDVYVQYHHTVVTIYMYIKESIQTHPQCYNPKSVCLETLPIIFGKRTDTSGKNDVVQPCQGMNSRFLIIIYGAPVQILEQVQERPNTRAHAKGTYMYIHIYMYIHTRTHNISGRIRTCIKNTHTHIHT